MNFLIVVDMQNDFISGSLGSPHAADIVVNVVDKVKNFNGKVIFTRDTHSADYMNTQEGKKLPVKHCIKDTPGWEICDELKPYVQTVVDKPTFGSIKLPHLLSSCGGEINRIDIGIFLCFLDLCLMKNDISFERELFTDNAKDDCEEVLTAKYTLLQ